MDPDALQDEVDEWVRDGIISEAQAEEIMGRYEDEKSRQSRVVVALSLVGAALVFVGITLFLATNWEEFPRFVRAAVLVAGPGLSYAGGVAAYNRDTPQIGLALCILGATLIGPSLFLFNDLFSLGVDHVWLWLAWTAVALPTGQALGSAVGTGFGLLVLAIHTIELTEPANPAPVLSLLGVVLFAFGQRRSNRVTRTYQYGGIALLVVGLLVLTTFEGRFDQFDAELTVPAAGGLVGAVGAAGWLFYAGEKTESGWAVAGLVALGGSVAAAALAPTTIPGLVAFVTTHLATLGALLATGYLGYQTQSQRLIDLAAVGGLFQTLSFVSATVIDNLSGSVALVVAGLILLGAGVALERGRRSLRTRLEPQR